MRVEGYDFCGWATKNDLLCSDGRTIRSNAFAEQDGTKVPIVWGHGHNSVKNVLGHAVLENRPEGVYMYGFLNDSDEGRHAKESVKHGDVTKLSIYANKLKQNGGDVLHGIIREVSLVLAGANPGATIDCVMAHGDDVEEAMVFEAEGFELAHTEEKPEPKPEPKAEEKPKEEGEKVADSGDKTIQDVLDTLNDEQKDAVYALIGFISQESEGDNEMKHNAFDNEEKNEQVLSHAEELEIFEDAKRYGSLRESVLAHAATDSNGKVVDYGVADLEYLFPDAKALNNQPDFIKREDAWVAKFKGAAHKVPFSRIKTIHANITEEDARALGYIKGRRKKEEVFTLLKRKTDPQTIYKKQKADRDDIADITSFSYVQFIRKEMDGMLDEEVARAGLVGDGRSSASEDHISHDHIRPIWTDEDLYTIKNLVSINSGSTPDQKTTAILESIIRSRKNYKGSGNPTFFTTDDFITDCLLLKDNMGHYMYESIEKLATKLRVKEIVPVPVMENLTRVVNGVTRNLVGIIVNPVDYAYGADEGGKKSFFEQFDIDFNQEKYLLETRCSGALIKPFSAIAVEQIWVAGFVTEPEDPSTVLFGKAVSDLQEDILIDDKAIEGSLKYVTGYTGYSQETELQSGNFLALKFTPASGATTVLELIGGAGGPITLDSNNNAVVRITNNNQKIKVTSTVGDESVTKVYSLRLLNLETQA